MDIKSNGTLKKARDIQRQVTRPTSVAVMLVLFQGFQLAFPHTMSKEWQTWTLDFITIVGGTGVIDKMIRNRKEIAEFFKSIFTKNKN